MSVQIDVRKLTHEHKVQIDTELFIKLSNTEYGGMCKFIVPYILNNNNLYLPFYYGVNIMKIKRRPRNTFTNFNLEFKGKLRPEQEIAKSEGVTILNKTGCVLLCLHVGFGKTIMAINLACDIRLKCVILVNTIVLMKQWKSSILKVCPEAKICVLTPGCEPEGDEQFFIINACNVEKRGYKFFNDIGLCIIDECHLIMAETLSRSLQYICPRYLIGLSATPYREDGLDKLLEFYFGTEKIIRRLKRKHTVYKVNTGFTPKVDKTKNGKLNWNTILLSQAMETSRNELIIKIIQHFKDRTILVLCKRVDQGQYIVNRLKECCESVTSLIGKQQEFDKEARILVGITKKVGTGFDHDKLDTLLLACDLEAYFIQSLGRVLRRQDVEPIIFDLVDNNRVLQSHFETRQTVYEEIGGNIISFNRAFPKLLSDIRPLKPSETCEVEVMRRLLK